MPYPIYGVQRRCENNTTCSFESLSARTIRSRSSVYVVALLQTVMPGADYTPGTPHASAIHTHATFYKLM